MKIYTPISFDDFLNEQLVEESKLGNLARAAAITSAMAFGPGGSGTPSINKPSMEVVKKADQTKDFLEAMADRESSGNWKSSKSGMVRGKDGILRPADYVGKYQFGHYAFQEIGKPDIRHRVFKRNPGIYPEAEQDADMIKLLKRNQHYLRNHMDYVGKVINGVEITESGMLAASHLVGNKAVRRFLESNGEKDKADGNGVRCSEYMKEFAGYNLKLN